MKLNIKDLTLLPLLGAIMYLSKLVTEALPNIHLLAMLIIVYTVVFRAKALIPIYIFVLLTGLYSGFALWWIPYLYIWLPLWAAVMLLPKNMKRRTAVTVYMALAACHGFLYGTMYAPAQAIMFHLSFKGTLSWIAAGLPWDFLHGCGNFAAAALALPLITAFRKALKAAHYDI